VLLKAGLAQIFLTRAQSLGQFWGELDQPEGFIHWIAKPMVKTAIGFKGDHGH
jgi:hypothetical protein